MPENQFGQIFGSALADIGKSIEEHNERRKRELSAGKASLALAKSLSPEDRKALALPDDDSLALLSPLDATAAVTGAIHSLGLKQGLARQRADADQQQRDSALNLDLGRYAQPGQLPYDISPQDFEQFALPEGQATPGPAQIMSSATRTGNLMNPQLDNLMLAASRVQPKALALDMGRQMVLPDGTTLTGTGGAPHVRNPEKPVKAPPKNPALVGKDATAALAAAMAYDDPAERAAALQAVQDAQAAYGHASVLERILLGDLSLDGKAGGGKAPGPEVRYKTLEEARKSGRKAGDKFMLWDDKQGRYRLFQMD